MGTQEQMAEIYAKLHENRYEHVEQARRARDMQAMNEELLDEVSRKNKAIYFYVGAVKRLSGGKP